MDPPEPSFSPFRGARAAGFPLKTAESGAESGFEAYHFGREQRLPKSSNQGRFAARSALSATKKGGALRRRAGPKESGGAPDHSHSIVPGGLLVTS